MNEVDYKDAFTKAMALFAELAAKVGHFMDTLQQQNPPEADERYALAAQLHLADQFATDLDSVFISLAPEYRTILSAEEREGFDSQLQACVAAREMMEKAKATAAVEAPDATQ